MAGYRIAAERALLGAVLLDPPAQQHVLDHVTTEDFARSWHAQVYEAMQRLRAARTPLGPQEVYQELSNDPDMPRELALNGVLVADLMAAAPRASHAPAYAATVAECGIRQCLWIAGSRVSQAAGSGDLDQALNEVGRAQRAVGECRTRWLSLPESFRRELLWPTAEPRRHAAAATAPVVRPRDPVAEAAGVRLLRELAAEPTRITDISRWLQSEHFARWRHGEIYALMRDMATAGLPVDNVTIAREAARRSLYLHRDELVGGTGAFAQATARDLYTRSVLAQINHVGICLQRDAASPRRSMTKLLDAVAGRFAHAGDQWEPEPWSRSRAEPKRSPEPTATVSLQDVDLHAHIRSQPSCRLEREAVS